MDNATDNATGAPHASRKQYLIGFGLCVVLTTASFALAGFAHLAAPLVMGLIALFAVVQIGVQLVFFLHLNASSGQRWNFLAFVYTLILLVMLVGLSIWIMAHLGRNMMGP